MIAMIAELIDLLTCGDLDSTERDEIAHRVVNAPRAPDLSWVNSPEGAMSFELLCSVSDYVATGDKIDEVHEQIQEMFESPFPSFPYELNSSKSGKTTPLEYFEWLDRELSQRATQEGGYDLIDLDDMVSENMNIFVFYRRDTSRIIHIATELELRIDRPLDVYQALRAKIYSLPFGNP
jgi:hypothetical protein